MWNADKKYFDGVNENDEQECERKFVAPEGLTY